MAKIAWTPANSEMGVGTVILERPTEPLTMDRYRGLLAGRIDRSFADRAELGEVLLERGGALLVIGSATETSRHPPSSAIPSTCASGSRGISTCRSARSN